MIAQVDIIRGNRTIWNIFGNQLQKLKIQPLRIGIGFLSSRAITLVFNIEGKKAQLS